MIHNEDAYKRVIMLTWKDDTIITLSDIIQKCIKECENWDEQNCEIHYKVGANKISDSDFRIELITVRNDYQQIDIYIEPTGIVFEKGGSCIDMSTVIKVQDEDIV